MNLASGYCAECRETGRYPWQHGDDCTVGLKQWLATLRAVVVVLIAALVLNAMLLAAAFAMLGDG